MRQNELSIAAKMGDLELVTRIVADYKKKGVSPELLGLSIQEAADAGHADILRVLIQPATDASQSGALGDYEANRVAMAFNSAFQEDNAAIVEILRPLTVRLRSVQTIGYLSTHAREELYGRLTQVPQPVRESKRLHMA